MSCCCCAAQHCKPRALCEKVLCYPSEAEEKDSHRLASATSIQFGERAGGNLEKWKLLPGFTDSDYAGVN